MDAHYATRVRTNRRQQVESGKAKQVAREAKRDHHIMGDGGSDVTPGTVGTDWLKQRIGSDQSANIRVLDVTWYSAKDAYPEYLKAHIPGAAWFDIMRDVTHTELHLRNLPAPEAFQQQVRLVGVDADTHVIVYDSQGLGGCFVGSRAWWMFKLFGHEKVSVLNGGLQRWIADGLPTTQEIPTYQEGNITVTDNVSFKKLHAAMVANFEAKCFQVCDSRAVEKFSAGHYPGARNIPFAAMLLDKDTNMLKTPDQLRQVFTEAGIDSARPLVTMCNSGMSSCSLLLAAYQCGNTDAAVYHGGYNEWKTLATSPDMIER
ncbi:Thiosulfate sulfurtransferase [Lamellibrachia satsuma]|nr:Thiosulfate sulfurtransferase [Lamellibrachia satsuma]